MRRWDKEKDVDEEDKGGRRVVESGQSEVPSGSQRGGDTLPADLHCNFILLSHLSVEPVGSVIY